MLLEKTIQKISQRKKIEIWQTFSVENFRAFDTFCILIFRDLENSDFKFSFVSNKALTAHADLVPGPIRHDHQNRLNAGVYASPFRHGMPFELIFKILSQYFSVNIFVIYKDFTPFPALQAYSHFYTELIFFKDHLQLYVILGD